MTKKNKNKKISASLKSTRQKRNNQECRVFEVKVDKSYLNENTFQDTIRLFLESKWFRNHALSQKDVFDVDDKIEKVKVKVKDKFEKRELKVLGSQIKQSILAELRQDIYNLSAKKKKGYKVGALKFKSRCDSINLKQFGNTYQIKGNRIKIQGIKQWFRVRGLNQVEGYEIANAKFIEKGGDFYFHITCYRKKQRQPKKEKPLNFVATDFGIKNQITLSKNIQINYSVEMPDRFRTLCKNLSKKEKFSSNWNKAKVLVQKEYLKTNNQKKDIKNKILHILKDEFNPIIFQNDCMQGWQRIWGKRMFNTAIGGIIADLRKSATAIKVDRFFPSTKRCSSCHHIQNVGLDERIFVCEKCNYTTPRDLNSTYNIEEEGLKKLGVEYTKYTPVETKPLPKLLERFNSIPRVKASFVVDTGSPMALAVG